jgi:hypothetical protein
MRRYASKIEFLSFLLYFFCFDFWLESWSCFLHHKNANAWIFLIKGVIDGLKLKSGS